MLKSRHRTAKPHHSRKFHTTKSHHARQIRRTGINLTPNSSHQSNSIPFNTPVILHTPTQFPTAQYSPSRFFNHVDTYSAQRTFRIDRTTNHLGDFASIIARVLNERCGPESTPPSTKNIDVLLYGDLGAGKTFFSRDFIRTLAESPALPVHSPTFNIELTYRHNTRVIKHIDLYRLKQSEEAHILFDHLPTDQDGVDKPQIIKLMEWPHILHNSRFMPPEYIRVDLEDLVTNDGHLKDFTISFKGDGFKVNGVQQQILGEIAQLHQASYPQFYNQQI